MSAPADGRELGGCLDPEGLVLVPRVVRGHGGSIVSAFFLLSLLRFFSVLPVEERFLHRRKKTEDDGVRCETIRSKGISFVAVIPRSVSNAFNSRRESWMCGPRKVRCAGQSRHQTERSER